MAGPIPKQTPDEQWSGRSTSTAARSSDSGARVHLRLDLGDSRPERIDGDMGPERIDGDSVSSRTMAVVTQ
jgi:hypothetical protein